MAELGRITKLEIQNDNGQWIDITSHIKDFDIMEMPLGVSIRWKYQIDPIEYMDYWHWLRGDSDLRNN